MSEIVREMRDKAVEEPSWSLIGSGWGRKVERLQIDTEYKKSEDLHIAIKVAYKKRSEDHHEVSYKKEIQEIVQWTEMELNMYNEKVGDREVFHEEKERVEDTEKAEDLVKKYIQQAEDEMEEKKWPDVTL